MASVVLQYVEKVYPHGVRAVDGLCLDVADGELVVLVGPSGCGKTTTLRLIAGLETATRGVIAIGGRTVNHLPPHERNVAMVFQNPALYPHLTVRGNMAFPLKLRGMRKAEIQRRVGEAARVLGMEQLLDRKPSQLSGGQGQRAALGRALVRDPACLLLDEPLSQLDGPLRLELRAEIQRIHRQLGRTIVYVTHDQHEAMALGGRVAVMWQGRIQQLGPPDELQRRPANRFVAGFLGSPPMVYVEGRLVWEADRLWFDSRAGRIALPASAAQTLASRANASVVLGVRPENLVPRPIPGQPPSGLTFHVDPHRVQFFAPDESGRPGERLAGGDQRLLEESSSKLHRGSPS